MSIFLYLFLFPYTTYANTTPPECENIETTLSLSGAASGAADAAMGNSPVSANESVLCAPVPRIKIPGLSFTSTTDYESLVERDGEGEIIAYYIPFLGQYLSAIYRYTIALAGVVCIFLLIFSGIQWTLYGASADNVDAAKERIQHAITGLILITSSYTILYTIDPNLVEFKSLKVRTVEKYPILSIDSITETLVPFNASSGNNNVPDYKQFDVAWGNERYGSAANCTTIAEAGCGPTSLAMIFSAYGVSTTPNQTAAFIGQSAEYGRSCNNGTNIGRALSRLDERPEWADFLYNNVTKDEALQLLQQGKPIIMHCRNCTGTAGTPEAPISRTYGGHYIVLTGLDQNGNVTVNDPGGTNGRRAIRVMSPEQLINSANLWYVYRPNYNRQVGTDTNQTSSNPEQNCSDC